MPANGRYNSGEKEKQVLFPIHGGIVDKIQPLLKYAKPFPRPGTLAEVFLIMRNNTDKRVEGWLAITPPYGWIIEPGRRLMIAIRPQGTILAEFFLSTPELPAQGPHLLQIRITAEDALLAEAAFDLRSGLLFLVDS